MTLIAAHLAFYFFELLLGSWLLWRSAEWLGYLDCSRTVGGFAALFGGLGLVAHGGSQAIIHTVGGWHWRLVA